MLILLDDLGFSDFGCFGAEIRTPHIDALAAHGLRFSQYTTVPMCTPARAALLTGKNPHAVGCGWLTFNTPGYPGYQAGEISRDAPTMAELLRAHGYSTYAVGKWHNTAEYNVAPAADRASWPLQRGFDRFYGFIGGETHYFAPAQLVEDNALVDRDTYPGGLLLQRRFHGHGDPLGDIARVVVAGEAVLPLSAIQRTARAAAGEAGRSRALRRSRTTPAGMSSAQRASNASARWACMHAHSPCRDAAPACPHGTMSAAERRTLYARYMELYAAIVDNIDQNIGRLKDHLTRLGRLDNTLFIVTSDNGANGIGGVEGAVNNLAKRLMRTEDPDVVRRVLDDGRLGAADTWPAYPLGWTDVSSAPFRLYKTTTMNGGIRVPFVAHWPAGIRDEGAVRHQWMHVTDVLPTLLDVLDVRYPERFGDHPTRCDGRRQLRARSSQAATRDLRAHSSTTSSPATAGSSATAGKSCRCSRPAQPMDLDNWMLFDLVNDATEIAGSCRRSNPVEAGASSWRRSTPMPLRTTFIRSTIATSADR